MSDKISITILVDNTVYKQGLLAEHGLSLLIECDGEKILFDTGQGMALPNNMLQLGISEQSISMLVLSHNHYDHTGGIDGFLDKADSQIQIYAHPDCLNSCFSKRGDVVRNIGLSDGARERLSDHKANINWTTEPTRLSQHVWVTGSVPNTSCSAITDSFYSDTAASRLNELNDDQGIYIITDGGVIVVLGCAHSGVVDTIEYIKQLTGMNICAVIGGMHLIHASEIQRKVVSDYLMENDIPVVAPLHCSGFEGRRLFANVLGGRYRDVGVGSKMEFIHGALI